MSSTRMRLAICVLLMSPVVADAVAKTLYSRTVLDSDLRPVPRAIENAIRSSPVGPDHKHCFFEGAPLPSRDGLKLYFVTTYESCNWFYINGPIFVLSAGDEGARLLLHTQGYSAESHRIEGQQFDGLKVTHDTFYHAWYQFDGNQFNLVKETPSGRGGRGGYAVIYLLIVFGIYALASFYLDPSNREDRQGDTGQKNKKE